MHDSLAEDFSTFLCDALATITTGPREAPETLVSNLLYKDAFDQAVRFLQAHNDWIIRCGRIDSDCLLFEPAVLTTSWRPDFHPPEFFSPIFVLIIYRSARDLERWFNSPQELKRGMYVSIYGEPRLDGDLLGTSVVCRDRTTFEVENGNEPFGGYGIEASSVSRDGILVGKPILLSSELSTLNEDRPDDSSIDEALETAS